MGLAGMPYAQPQTLFLKIGAGQWIATDVADAVQQGHARLRRHDTDLRQACAIMGFARRGRLPRLCAGLSRGGGRDGQLPGHIEGAARCGLHHLTRRAGA